MTADPHPAAPDAITAYLDGQAAAQVAMLAELVRVPSDNPPGDCDPHARHTAALLEGLGFTVERHPVSAAELARVGMVSATNLIVRQRFGPGPVVALNAHGDVVPPGEGWTHAPYAADIVDGWMIGRGVAVSKCDIATYAYAMKALEAAGHPLNGTVELHVTYDEEAGGEIGPALILRQGLSRPDLAIGAGFSYAVVDAHDGCLHLEVEVNGKSAHAAMPATGADALEAATAVLHALYAWRLTLRSRVSAIAGIGSPQLTVGLIRGGINTNVVPDRVTFRLDRRIVPEEAAAEVEAELRRLVEGAVAERAGIGVTIRRILLAEPLVPHPQGRRLTEVLCRHASVIMGEPVSAKGVPLYTDARHYAAAGVPTVLFGAGPHTIEEANAHRADERLPLADLRRATEVVARTLVELLS